MGLRITTWNVNGIRNPFGYQPWRDRRTFEGMFDILEADIVIFQETKIQRKDLRDDMVLIPGWDVYFSLPKHKKGYSGVAIFTRNAVCAPIRAEEGVTGFLCPPNSSTSFRDLPHDQQIGGYPTQDQLDGSSLDPLHLDSEGRCVILEFPAFVLIGVYCPANRDESRDDFRLGFLNLLDSRIRNLNAEGKRVILTGDLNIIREEIDTANAEEQLRKQGLSGEDYVSTPARRIFNQLILNGKVVGERDPGREKPVLFDICRGFHPNRKGMFTCWEQKINARPGNFGSRIDYVLCSIECKEWFGDSNIQEGLMGSDHCPVYAVMRDEIQIRGKSVHAKDVMNPPGIFENGLRKQEWSSRLLLPTSAKLIPEFDRRRNIRDMFSTRPSLKAERTSISEVLDDTDDNSMAEHADNNESKLSLAQGLPQANSSTLESSVDLPKTVTASPEWQKPISSVSSPNKTSKPISKRPNEAPSNASSKKRARSNASNSTSGQNGLARGQSTLKGFFKPKTSSGTPNAPVPVENPSFENQEPSATSSDGFSTSNGVATEASTTSGETSSMQELQNKTERSKTSKPVDPDDQDTVIDPIVAKESWSKLLGKRVVPRCEHNEPCVSYLTKKPGINCGRSFYICPRPLGPSGVKEKGTQWRCGTFIWSSDWTGDAR